MIFKYSPHSSGKVYTFKDLDEGETFMLSDPRSVIAASDEEYTTVFEVCSVYMVVDDKDHAINLDNGHLLSIDSGMVVYPVVCECSVSLYPDVY